MIAVNINKSLKPSDGAIFLPNDAPYWPGVYGFRPYGGGQYNGYFDTSPGS